MPFVLPSQCDGRIITAPSVGAAPSAAAVDPAGASTTGGGICSLCDRYQKLVLEASIAFQTQTTTCGDLDAMLDVDGILGGSATCNNIRGTYQNACCSEACRLCQTYGDVLDLRGEHMVMQGEHGASCSEIDGILSESSSSSERICVDAKTRLADQCCYRQCSLCAIGTMRTEWYNTVVFEGLTTTCLGLDYALRAEQVPDGSYRCSELQGEYVSQCCRASGTACQLCSSGDKLYQIYSDKVITEPSSNRQLTTTTCAAANDSLAKLEKSDQKCTEGLQALFGQCCDLSIVLDNGPDSTSLGGGEASTEPNTASDVASGAISNPSSEGGGAPTPASSGSGPIPYSPGSRGPPGEGSEVQSKTTKPTPTHVWGSSSDMSNWEGLWESKKNSGFSAAALHTSFVMCGLSILLLLV